MLPGAGEAAGKGAEAGKAAAEIPPRAHRRRDTVLLLLLLLPLRAVPGGARRSARPPGTAPSPGRRREARARSLSYTGGITHTSGSSAAEKARRGPQPDGAPPGREGDWGCGTPRAQGHGQERGEAVAAVAFQWDYFASPRSLRRLRGGGTLAREAGTTLCPRAAAALERRHKECWAGKGPERPGEGGKQCGKMKLWLVPPACRPKSSDLGLSRSRGSRRPLSAGIGCLADVMRKCKNSHSKQRIGRRAEALLSYFCNFELFQNWRWTLYKSRVVEITVLQVFANKESSLSFYTS
ncbi:uncharacterized protein LOC108641912 [Manacus vitellinus]|uniref:uncharacterized protein LOC108641912 n=1 Tax=Manacus vitellinus TaxID=328815 RepID=UPI00115CA68A|nr:uncharacterized protein LOC108641912 [Manacus vitellinus]